MGFLLRFIFKLLLLIVIVGGVVIWSAGYFFPQASSAFVKSKTGFGLNISKSDNNFFVGRLDVGSIVLSNTSSYEDKSFADMNQLKVDVDIKSLIEDVKVVREIIADVDSVAYVKNAAGKVNLVEFADNFKGAESSEPEAKKPASEVKYHLKKVHVKIGKVKVIDYSGGGSPSIQEFELNYDRTFTGVRDIEADLVKPLSSDMMRAGVSAFAKVLLKTLLDPAKLTEGLLKGTGNVIKGVGEGAGNVIKGVGEGTGKVIKGVGEGAGKVINGVTDGVKGVFSK